MKGWMPREWSMEIDYLLGRMDETGRAGFQARILEDPEAFAKVAEVENELFDAYAQGVLPPDLRSRFEKTLLKQPDAARKLAVARRLAGTRTTSSGKLIWLAVAAGVVAVIGASFYAGRFSQRDTAPLVLRLPPIQRGSPEIPVYEIRPSIVNVELVAPVPAGPAAPEYSVVLATVKEAGVEQWTSVKPAGGELRLSVPAAKLPPGAYVLNVRDGTGPVAFHEFRIRGSDGR